MNALPGTGIAQRQLVARGVGTAADGCPTARASRAGVVGRAGAAVVARRPVRHGRMRAFARPVATVDGAGIAVIAGSGRARGGGCRNGQGGDRRRRENRRGSRDRVFGVDREGDAADRRTGRDDTRRAVPEVYHRRVADDDLVLVDDLRRSGSDRHGRAGGHAEHRAVARADRVAPGAGLIEHLEPDVHGCRREVGADDLGVEAVDLDRRRNEQGELGGLTVTERRERGILDAGQGGRRQPDEGKRNGQEERNHPGSPSFGQGTGMSGRLATVGGGLLQGAAGSQIKCSLSTSIAVQEMFFEVATTRPDPFRRLFVVLPVARLSVIEASSWSTAVGDVLTVFVWPGPTLRTAPSLPALIAFRSAPVSSKRSTPMSCAAESRLVQKKAVSRLLFLITPTAV